MRFPGWPALLAGWVGLYGLLGASAGADDQKEVREGVLQLAAAIEKKDDALAKKLAAELVKKFEMDSIMALHAERGKGGLGVSAKPDEVKPDGIEKKIVALAKKPLPADQLHAEADALAQMGYRMAALADLTLAAPPDKDKKVWTDSAADYKAAGLLLVEGARAKKADVVHQAAKKADSSCLKCHDVFR